VPSGSDDPDALKPQVSALHADVNDATGGALGATTVTVRPVWLVAAPLSVTVRVTV